MNPNDTPETDKVDDDLSGDWETCYHQMHKHAIRLEIRMKTFERQAQNLYTQLKAATSGPTISVDLLKGMSMTEFATWLNNQEDQETRKITIPTT